MMCKHRCPLCSFSHTFYVAVFNIPTAANACYRFIIFKANHHHHCPLKKNPCPFFPFLPQADFLAPKKGFADGFLPGLQQLFVQCKATESEDCQSPLNTLLVDGFDPEQVWGKLTVGIIIYK